MFGDGHFIVKTAILSLCLMFVLAAFSGCTGDGKGGDTTSTTVPPTTTATSPTSTPSPTASPDLTSVPPTTISDPPPGKPVANLTADIVNGTTPMDVTFSIIDSSEEGGNYNWTIEFGDGNSTNGTDVPAVVEHTFFEIGEYVANLTLSNEAGESNASLNITARDFAAERHAGAWETGVLACVAGSQEEWQFSEFNETSHVEFPVNNTTWNLTFFAVFDADGADSWMVDFYDEDAALVASFTQTDNSTVNGTVPENATLLVLWACQPSGGGSAEYAAASDGEWARQREPEPEDEEE